MKTARFWPVMALLLCAVCPPQPIAAREGAGVIHDLARRGFKYFEEHHDPATGLVRDRAGNFEGRGSKNAAASIAATGYYISFLPEAVRLGWIGRDEAQRAARQVLITARDQLQTHHGAFYHFYDVKSVAPARGSEVSTLDTAIFLNSVAVITQFFPSLEGIGNEIIDRVDWSKFVVEKNDGKLLSLGWSPGRGLLGTIDARTSEGVMPYLLAIGSSTHPIDIECWYATSVAFREVAGYRVLHGQLPLFCSYYGNGWACLRGFKDKEGVNLFENARIAALANRKFCQTVAAEDYRTYALADGRWHGLSAGDSKTGYVAIGPVFGEPDGTVFPMAALGALPWIPNELEADVQLWTRSPSWERALGKYGLSPFDDNGWVGPDIIGIDIGAFLLGFANHNNETIWKLWQQHPVARRAIERIGFTKNAAFQPRTRKQAVFVFGLISAESRFFNASPTSGESSSTDAKAVLATAIRESGDQGTVNVAIGSNKPAVVSAKIKSTSIQRRSPLGSSRSRD